MRGATLDTGALIAFERSKRAMVLLVNEANERGDLLAVPAGVVAQAWRDGARQARLARLLGSEVIEVIELDDRTARAVGQLCGVTGATDVVDASVVLCARDRGHTVLTSDPKDLRRIDPELSLVRI
jgi:hypothetical protein